MNEYSLLIFDCDGTLVNSDDLVIHCAQEMARELDVPSPTISHIQLGFGMHLQNFCQHVFPNHDWQICSKIFYRYYTPENLSKNFFAGALETLTHLKRQGFILAMATNTVRAAINAILEQVQGADLFVALRCGDDGFIKPHPEMLLGLLRELNIKSKNALFIGDTLHDLQLAQNAGVDFLAVAYDQKKSEKFLPYNPIGFLGDIRELKTLGIGAINVKPVVMDRWVDSIK